MGSLQLNTYRRINRIETMGIKLLFALCILSLSPIESHKSINHILSILKDIKKNMCNVNDVVQAITPIIEDNCACCKNEGYESPIKKNHSISEIPEWGPAWRISFELNIASYFNDGQLFGNVFHFTSTGNDCCDIGDRIPALFTGKDERLYYMTNIGDNGNYVTYSNTNAIKTNTWYSYDIEQYFVSNQLINTLKVMEYGTGTLIWNLELQNNNPQMFYNVQVYAGDPFYNPSDATIRNFQYSSLTKAQV